MHRVFQTFIDRIAESANQQSFRDTMADVAIAFDLQYFAYLSLPHRRGDKPQLISTYPSEWTTHYLHKRYERLDPVIIRAVAGPEPFEWGPGIHRKKMSMVQRELFDEASSFGIRHGFTVPIHDRRGPVAAFTFAADAPRPAFERRVRDQGQVLQLIALYFHAHVCRRLVSERMVDGILLSPRQFECLAWAAQGKSAWEIGRILGIGRRAVVFHLDSAKAKLGVRSICQAVARLAASRSVIR
jgi:LuxR family transcriptional regulator, activator of conjugal transfer of Ti plasmids